MHTHFPVATSPDDRKGVGLLLLGLTFVGPNHRTQRDSGALTTGPPPVLQSAG